MEHINRVVLLGEVGTVRLNVVQGMNVSNFSVGTTHYVKTAAGAVVAETTWWQVTAWEGKGIDDLKRIEKGCAVHVKGRVRMQRYTAADGTDRTFYEVMASELSVMDKE